MTSMKEMIEDIRTKYNYVSTVMYLSVSFILAQNVAVNMGFKKELIIY